MLNIQYFEKKTYLLHRVPFHLIAAISIANNFAYNLLTFLENVFIIKILGRVSEYAYSSFRMYLKYYM